MNNIRKVPLHSYFTIYIYFIYICMCVYNFYIMFFAGEEKCRGQKLGCASVDVHIKNEKIKRKQNFRRSIHHTPWNRFNACGLACRAHESLPSWPESPGILPARPRIGPPWRASLCHRRCPHRSRATPGVMNPPPTHTRVSNGSNGRDGPTYK